MFLQFNLFSNFLSSSNSLPHKCNSSLENNLSSKASSKYLIPLRRFITPAKQNLIDEFSLVGVQVYLLESTPKFTILILLLDIPYLHITF